MVETIEYWLDALYLMNDDHSKSKVIDFFLSNDKDFKQITS